jgi:hypothetical protein
VHTCHRTQREREGKKERKEREERGVEKKMKNTNFGVQAPSRVQTSKECKHNHNPQS